MKYRVALALVAFLLAPASALGAQIDGPTGCTTTSVSASPVTLVREGIAGVNGWTVVAPTYSMAWGSNSRSTSVVANNNDPYGLMQGLHSYEVGIAQSSNGIVGANLLRRIDGGSWQAMGGGQGCPGFSIDGSPITSLGTLSGLKLDTEKPSLEIGTPHQGQSVSGNIKIEGKVSDSTSGIATVKANGTVLVVSGSGVISGSISLPTGEHVLTFVAKDNAGHETTMTRTVVVTDPVVVTPAADVDSSKQGGSTETVVTPIQEENRTESHNSAQSEQAVEELTQSPGHSTQNTSSGPGTVISLASAENDPVQVAGTLAQVQGGTQLADNGQSYTNVLGATGKRVVWLSGIVLLLAAALWGVRGYMVYRSTQTEK